MALCQLYMWHTNTGNKWKKDQVLCTRGNDRRMQYMLPSLQNQWRVSSIPEMWALLWEWLHRLLDEERQDRHMPDLSGWDLFDRSTPPYFRQRYILQGWACWAMEVGFGCQIAVAVTELCLTNSDWKIAMSITLSRYTPFVQVIHHSILSINRFLRFRNFSICSMLELKIYRDSYLILVIERRMLITSGKPRLCTRLCRIRWRRYIHSSSGR